MKQIYLYLMFLLVIIIGCNDSATPTEQTINTPVSASITLDSMRYTIQLTKNDYNINDSLQGEYTVLNLSSNSKSFHFSIIHQIRWMIENVSDNVTYIFLPLNSVDTSYNIILNSKESLKYFINTSFYETANPTIKIKSGEYKFNIWFRQGIQEPFISVNFNVK